MHRHQPDMSLLINCQLHGESWATTERKNKNHLFLELEVKVSVGESECPLVYAPGSSTDKSDFFHNYKVFMA